MWKVLPKFGFAKILLLLLCLLLTIGLVWSTQGWLGLTAFFADDGLAIVSGIVTPVLFVFASVIWLLGKFVWRCFWKTPIIGTLLNQKVCPDLNGCWMGNIVSMYDGQRIEKEVKMNIDASFFGFTIHLKSTDGYQRSTVMQSELFKDSRDGSFYLSYIFESVVDQPKPTDQSKFDGAARLHVRFEDSGIKLVGVYWTNRGWQKQEQTAGTINLQRVQSKVC